MADITNPLSVTPIPGDPDKYLGNTEVTSALFHQFARDAVINYDAFLRGEKSGEDAQQAIEAMIRRYADIFMGRSKEYTPAKWHRTWNLGARLRGMYPIDIQVDPGVGYFTFLADQCQQAAMAMVNGMSEDEAGAQLAEIVEDGVGRFMLVIT